MTGRSSPRWALLERYEIPDLDNPTEVYLRRWRIIQTPWAGIMLHHILLPDTGSRDVHDHPWTFISVLLAGGYEECVQRPDGTKRWVHRIHRGGITYRPAETLHRITKLWGDTWTLVLHGPRRREWGFQVPGRGWVHWATWCDEALL